MLIVRLIAQIEHMPEAISCFVRLHQIPTKGDWIELSLGGLSEGENVPIQQVTHRTQEMLGWVADLHLPPLSITRAAELVKEHNWKELG